jgi:dephospho-CoA kinase
VPYVIKEAALIFEAGAAADLDKIIVVSAPEHLRISRTIERDGVTEADIRARMKNQWPEEEKLLKADYIIDNDEGQSLILQVMNVHQQLLQLQHSEG